MKITCKDCGWIGEDFELDEVTERVGEYCGEGAYQTFATCPNCGSTSIEEYDEPEEEEGDE